MRANKCSFWFIHSFILEKLDFAEFTSALSKLKLSPIPNNLGFTSYVSFRLDEMVCKPKHEPKSGEPAKIRIRGIAQPVKVRLRRRFYFELTGLCSHVLEMELTLEHVPHVNISDAIRLSCLFEEKSASRATLCTALTSRSGLSPSEFVSEDIRTLVKTIRKHASPDVTWLDDPKASHRSITHTVSGQTPYVVTLLGYENENKYRDQIIKPIESTAFREPGSRPDLPKDVQDASRKLAALLYRFKKPNQWNKVDSSYVRAFSSERGRGIENYHVHEDVFLTIHLRSVLVAYNSNATKRDGEPPLLDFFLPALQATLAEARTNWFGFVLANAYVDSYVQTLTTTPKVLPSEMIRAIMVLRRRILTLLNSTVSYKRSSGSLERVYSEFYRIFGVNRLRDDALAKIDLLEKLYYNLQQIRMAESPATSR